MSAYHHIDNLVTITKILSSYLKPDHGQLIVLDLKKDHSKLHLFFQPNEAENHVINTVAHKGGFEPEELKQIFIETGSLKDVEVDVAFQFDKYVESEDKTYTFEYLLARGKKKITTSIG